MTYSHKRSQNALQRREQKRIQTKYLFDGAFYDRNQAECINLKQKEDVTAFLDLAAPNFNPSLVPDVEEGLVLTAPSGDGFLQRLED